MIELAPTTSRPLAFRARPLPAGTGELQSLQRFYIFADDERLLRVAVQLPADFEGDPEAALSSFDCEWWLSNCHRSGAVVFDYERPDVL